MQAAGLPEVTVLSGWEIGGAHKGVGLGFAFLVITVAP
jgi:hypothetical protein